MSFVHDFIQQLTKAVNVREQKQAIIAADAAADT
jgi:hypothetical protein